MDGGGGGQPARLGRCEVREPARCGADTDGTRMAQILIICGWLMGKLDNYQEQPALGVCQHISLVTSSVV